jgi:hypothetical protein
MMGSASDAAGGVMGDVTSSATDAMSGAPETAQSVMADVSATASDATSAVSDTAGDAMSSAQENAEHLGEHAHGESESFLERAKDMLGGLFGGGGSAEKTDAS